MSNFYPTNPSLGQQIQTNVSIEKADLGFIAHLIYDEAKASAADTDAIFDGINASGDTAFSVNTTNAKFIAQPSCARNITATATGTAGDVKAVQIIINGTDMNDEPITETLPAFTVDTLGSVVGSKAFKTVTSVTIPAMDGSGVVIDIGAGSKLGIPYTLPHNTCLFAFLGNVKEGTVPTVATSSTSLSNNTITLNSSLNGKQIDAYFVV